MNTNKQTVEHHPFEAFIPKNAKVLILGSFPGAEQTGNPDKEHLRQYEWFYGAARNKFWHIMEAVYSTPLKTKTDKQQLFEKAGIAITDIISSAIRKEGKNVDSNLIIEKFNDDIIKKIINSNKIETIFFTSKFVEGHFKKLFPAYTNCEYLPSPSPLYFRMKMETKIAIYKEKLPKL